MKKASHLNAQFNRVSISGRDFEEARVYLEEYRTGLPKLSEMTKRALLLATIIAYSRPFTSNSSGKNKQAISTLPGNPKAILSTQEFVLHQKIFKIRNEALAHSDFDRNPTRRIGVAGTGFLVGSRSFDILSERIDPDVFSAMCDKMRRFCTDKSFEIDNRLKMGEGN